MNEYNTTDQRLHFLSQVLAKANRTYIPKKEDDSHTNLFYDFLGDRIAGRWIESPMGKTMLSFNLSNFNFEWLNESLQVINAVNSIGKTIYNIENELSKNIQNFGLNPEGFSDNLHFEIPDYPFKNDIITRFDPAHLEQWKYYRKLANDVCGWLLGHLQTQGEIRIWPHHFDTGLYVVQNDKTGIGFGLAMEDSMAKSPYFYYAGYGLKEEISYSNLPNIGDGSWEIGGSWKGAILALSKFEALDEKDTQQAIINFLQAATSWYLNKT